MQLEYLREFRELCVNYQINFSNASEALHLTQPALSNHINQIENEMDIQLIDRGKGRSSSLTPAGIVFLNRIDELLDILTNIQSDCHNAAFMTKHIVRMHMPLFIPDFLANIILKFKQIRHNENAIVLIEEVNCIDPLIELKNRNIDCCLFSFINENEISIDSEFTYTLFPHNREEILIWLDKKHPLASQETIKRDDLNNLIIPNFTLPLSNISHIWINNICKELNCSAKQPTRYANSFNESFLNQYSTEDITFLPECYINYPVIDQNFTRTLRSLEPPLYFTYCMIFRKEETNRAIIQFKNFLEDNA